MIMHRTCRSFQRRHRQIFKLAGISRFFIIFVQIFGGYLIPNHEPDVFQPPQGNITSSITDIVIDSLLGGFTAWDAAYFLHVAQHDYTYENSLAFFPLLPGLVKHLCALLWPVFKFVHISERAALLATGVALSNASFALAAVVLYDLGRRLLPSETLAFRAAVLFCFNPASVFFSSVYSESVFAALSLSGMWLCEQDLPLPGALVFGLAGAARSNGLVCGGFVAHKMARQWLAGDPRTVERQGVSGDPGTVARQGISNDPATAARQGISGDPGAVARQGVSGDPGTVARQRDSGEPGIVARQGVSGDPWRGLAPLPVLVARFPWAGVKLAASALACTAPWLLWQMHVYAMWCSRRVVVPVAPDVQEYGARRGYTVLTSHTSVPPWCRAPPWLSYAHVQRTHWGLGPFAYFTWRQVPNFLLAAPALYLAAWAVRWACVQSGGLPTWRWLGLHPAAPSLARLVPYTAHTAFLAAFALVFMHVQVATRLLCSSTPLIYWYAASVMRAPWEVSATSWRGWTRAGELWRKEGAAGKAILLYFASYLFVGTLAHTNFWPWT